MDRKFYHTLHNGSNYLFILGLKINQISKRSASGNSCRGNGLMIITLLWVVPIRMSAVASMDRGYCSPNCKKNMFEIYLRVFYRHIG